MSDGQPPAVCSRSGVSPAGLQSVALVALLMLPDSKPGAQPLPAQISADTEITHLLMQPACGAAGASLSIQWSWLLITK